MAASTTLPSKVEEDKSAISAFILVDKLLKAKEGEPARPPSSSARSPERKGRGLAAEQGASPHGQDLNRFWKGEKRRKSWVRLLQIADTTGDRS